MSELPPDEAIPSCSNGFVYSAGNRRFHLTKELTDFIFQFLPNTPEIRKKLTDVCKNWNDTIRHPVWINVKQRFRNELDGLTYEDFSSCNAYDKNLIRNHSGENGDLSHWIAYNRRYVNLSSDWEIIRNPPVNDNNIMLREAGLIASCFGTCQPSNKMQIINLLEEGILPIVMDKLQPKIYVSEWVGSPAGVDYSYNLNVLLTGSNFNIIRSHTHQHRERKGGIWHKVEYTFQNYGPGVRLITFTHGGRENTDRTHINGCWMTRANVQVLFDFSRSNGIVQAAETFHNNGPSDVLFPWTLVWLYTVNGNNRFYHPIYNKLR